MSYNSNGNTPPVSVTTSHRPKPIKTTENRQTETPNRHNLRPRIQFRNRPNKQMPTTIVDQNEKDPGLSNDKSPVTTVDHNNKQPNEPNHYHNVQTDRDQNRRDPSKSNYQSPVTTVDHNSKQPEQSDLYHNVRTDRDQNKKDIERIASSQDSRKNQRLISR